MTEEVKKRKVVFCMATLTRPSAPFIAALEETIPHIVAAGWDEGYVNMIGCPYISNARATLTRKAFDADADTIVYLDYDLSWTPESMLKLLSAEGEVVAGTYRFKKPDAEEYMGTINIDEKNRPIVRDSDGAIWAEWVPAGFLRVDVSAIRKMMKAFPSLLYGNPDKYSFDLFNHGAYRGLWYGEDYAFSRRWNKIGGQIWIVPDLDITHHNVTTGAAFPGNYHKFMLRQPGGSEALK